MKDYLLPFFVVCFIFNLIVFLISIFLIIWSIGDKIILTKIIATNIIGLFVSYHVANFLKENRDKGK